MRPSVDYYFKIPICLLYEFVFMNYNGDVQVIYKNPLLNQNHKKSFVDLMSTRTSICWAINEIFLIAIW